MQDRGTSLIAWLVRQALAGVGGGELLEALCLRLEAAGLPLLRTQVGASLLDPTLDAQNFSWRRGQGVVVRTFARSDRMWTHPSWTMSPFHHLRVTGGETLRRRIGVEGQAEGFPVLRDLAREGATDYLAIRVPYADPLKAEITVDLLSSWATDRPDGFVEADLALLRAVAPAFALAFAHGRNELVTRNLLATYLGADAAGRVLSGNVIRGRAEPIEAAIWLSDLEGFTRLADELPLEAALALLNDYAAALVEVVESRNGEVLKFMGDGMLAIFRHGDPADACADALAAAEAAQGAIRALNHRRRQQDLRTTEVALALHRGQLLYGNFGAGRRLDFTVLGPAVNEASRIQALCRSLDQRVIVSEALAATVAEGRDRLVGLGRYALKGVGHAQHLFTFDPAGRADQRAGPD